MKRFVTHLRDLLPYFPPGHSKTTNYRLLSPGPSGSDRFEVVLGQIEFEGQADPHAHDELEQAVFVLEGRGVAEIEGQQEEIGPNDLIYLPEGVRHRIAAMEGPPLKLLIIYAPPLSPHNKIFSTDRP
jgi:mannose-6-phosphate isomerase-like protein (cupin superfamily)